MIYVLLILALLSYFPAKAQDESSIKISLKAQPMYDVSNVYFSFLEGVKFYYEDWSTKEMKVLEPNLKTSGLVLHNYLVEMDYKDFTFSLKASTSKISPFFIRGYHRVEDEVLGKVIVGDISRNTHSFSVGVRYNWKILNFHFGYEYDIENLSSVATGQLFGTALLSGRNEIGALTTGAGIKVGFGRFNLTGELSMSILGKLNYGFGFQDTTIFGNRVGSVHKYTDFNGKVNVFSYGFGLGYEGSKVGIMLRYAYNFAKSGSIFRRTTHRFGLGFMLRVN
jgi:hypothetical protein